KYAIKPGVFLSNPFYIKGYALLKGKNSYKILFPATNARGYVEFKSYRGVFKLFLRDAVREAIFSTFSSRNKG
ncbi:MAG: hypothetical protein ABWW65_02290, partial [Thermoprotei archaeon]